MKTLKIFSLTTALIVLLSPLVSGQQRIVDVGKEETSPLSGLFFVLGGEPYSFAKYVRVVEGSPFFNEDWMLGSMVLPGGKRYDSIELKIDLLTDEVHYKDLKGNPLIATTRIREIWLNGAAGKKFHFVHSSFIGTGTAATAGWHQMLTDGSAILFGKPVKEITEVKPYGSSVSEQRITTITRYFILSDNKLSPIKSLNVIPELFSQKSEQLKQFISTNKLKGKAEGDYISLVTYYNSLAVQ